MSAYANLSPHDRAVIEVLWKYGEMTTTEVHKKLDEKNWTRHTVRTYLLRLMEKSLVDVRKVSKKKQYYYTLISRDKFIAGETSEYLSERYKGLTHLIAGLTLGKKVTDDELAELEQYLQDYRKKGK